MKKFLAGISLMCVADGMILGKLFGNNVYLIAALLSVGSVLCFLWWWEDK